VYTARARRSSIDARLIQPWQELWTTRQVVWRLFMQGFHVTYAPGTLQVDERLVEARVTLHTKALAPVRCGGVG
jgi:hypothetical protein